VNDKQQAIVESFGQGLAVVAGAGCGKTTTLVAKCEELLNRNSKARFCAVSFTEKSVRDLKEALTRKLAPRDLSEHWVKTIHGLCAAILSEFPVAAGLQGGEQVLIEDEAARLWERSLEVLWSSNDNPEINAAIDRLLQVYSRSALEELFKKLRSLLSFGVEEFIQKSFDRQEVKDLWMVFHSVMDRYQHAKNRDGRLDFNDLELFAHRALQDSGVLRHFQNRFDLVLVDEFQDTNPLQGAILELFVKPDLSNFCIVGDPKQSIYRFRDADVSVFQDLTTRLPGRHILDENYRSRPAIIDFTNAVCAPVFAASELEYEPLLPKRDPVEGPGVTRLEWESEDELARFLKSEQARGVDLSEFVILARSIKKPRVLKFLAGLDAVGIPFLLGSGGRFFEDPRVQELCAFLRGWVSPGNRLSQATALRAPWIAMSDAWLRETALLKQSYFDRFFESVSHPVAVALRSRYLGPGRISMSRPGQILAELMLAPEIDEELSLALVVLWHKCEEFSRQGLRFEAVVQELTNAIESGKSEKEIPAPAERGMVRVMTIHGSKGLQFPRVILVDFEGADRNQGRTGDLIWNRKAGVHLIRRDENGDRIEDDAQNLKWKDLERQSAVAESKRVFYVALTRAQEELILLWKKDVKAPKKTEAAGYDPALEDNWRAWVETKGAPPPRVWEPLEGSSESPRDLPERAQALRLDFDPKPYRARHSPSEWLVLNQCALRYRKKFGGVLPESAFGLDGENSDGEEEAPVYGEVRSSTTVADQGKRIHKALELHDFDALAVEFQDPALAESMVFRVREFLELDSGRRVFPEFGFEVPLSPREALVGMMDRLEVDEGQGLIRIIDYKFTSTPKSGEALLQQYGLQLQLYAFAALSMVPFPVKRIEAFLVHFTEGGFWVHRAPTEWFDPELLPKVGAGLFAKAKGQDLTPVVGEYCRYCEFSEECPARRIEGVGRKG
jgi:ATP-dependent helicase/nuclease subunit A